MWDDDSGYDRSDPKHPSFRDNWTYRGDIDRKRAKENPPEPFTGPPVSRDEFDKLTEGESA